MLTINLTEDQICLLGAMFNYLGMVTQNHEGPFMLVAKIVLSGLEPKIAETYVSIIRQAQAQGFVLPDQVEKQLKRIDASIKKSDRPFDA